MTLLQRVRRVFRDMSELWLPRNRRKVIHTHINDFSLLILANEDVGRAIYFDRRFEEEETAFLTRTISPDAICMDVGANVGYFTLLLAKLAPQGTVYAFEPIPLNASLVRASAELNRYANIRVVQAAIGADDGEIALTESADSAYSSILDTGRRPAERVIHTALFSIDSFLERKSIESINILKIDVEGAEGLVITGAMRLLSDPARRPWLVMMEVSQRNLAAFGDQPCNILETMKSLGYAPHVACEGKAVPLEGPLGGNENVLFLLPESPGR